MAKETYEYPVDSMKGRWEREGVPGMEFDQKKMLKIAVGVKKLIENEPKKVVNE